MEVGARFPKAGKDAQASPFESYQEENLGLAWGCKGSRAL